jgi:hypothetical protein
MSEKSVEFGGYDAVTPIQQSEAWLQENHVFCSKCGARMKKRSEVISYSQKTGVANESVYWDCERATERHPVKDHWNFGVSAINHDRVYIHRP